MPDTEMPAFDLYEDDDPKQQPMVKIKIPDEEETPYQLLGEQATLDGIPTPEEGYEFVNETIMLPRGSGHDRGRVVRQKRDEDGTLWKKIRIWSSDG